MTNEELKTAIDNMYGTFDWVGTLNDRAVVLKAAKELLELKKKGTTNVIPINGLISHDIDPEDILDKAKYWGMKRCIVIGWNEDNELQFGGSFSGSPDIVFLLECAKQMIMTAYSDGSEIGITK